MQENASLIDGTTLFRSPTAAVLSSNVGGVNPVFERFMLMSKPFLLSFDHEDASYLIPAWSLEVDEGERGRFRVEPR